MTQKISQEQRDEIMFQIAEIVNFRLDKYLMKQMEYISVDYAKGYLEAFLANAGEDDIRLIYQLVKTLNMV